MSFFALSTGTLLGIFAAVAAATVALYVLKLRRRPVAVPFSPIWQRVLREKDASQLFSRLKNILSLLPQLVLLALIVLALGDPRPAAGSPDGRSVVVLVDTSASMQAVDGIPTRLAEAKKKVTDLVSGVSASDRMLVAKMDASTVPMTTMTSEPTELNEGIDRLTATDTRADLPRGIAFALDALRGATHPEIVLVSDGALDLTEATSIAGLKDVAVRYVPVGKRGKNVAVTEFSVRRYPLDASRYEVLLELSNTNDEPADVELTLLGDGEVVDVSRLTLKPKERLPRIYTELGGASRTLEARVRLTGSAQDDLPVDDHAYALMPERRRAKISLVANRNTYLEAALLLDEYLDVTNVAPGAYRPDGNQDVTIFDGVAPAAPTHGGALYLNPPRTADGKDPSGPLEVGKEIQSFGFDTWDRKSPILRFMAVEPIQVAKGHALVPEKADHVVGASELGPILVSGRREGHPFVVLGFDPRDSDLVLRPAWPLFVLNVIRSFAEDDASYLSSYRTGAAWKIPVPGDAPTAWIKDPAGVKHEVPVKEGRAAFFGERAGFYEVSVASGPVSLFAANLGEPEESFIEPAKELKLGGAALGPVTGFTAGIRSELWISLIIAAVLLSLLEWVTYHRRVTV